ncbi:MAG: hypothetical protein DME02_11830 [Candidatus Rokuibacteriota bacterium]|nr:MAG: hypothetical protein DME02_11830 [Candidatus Rokubacteria bacterium]
MPQLRLRGGEVDGLALNYLVEGRGPAVVLVHGLGGFAESWRHNIGSLAARATVYAIDLPGFGRSAKPRAAYSLAFFARTLHAFLDGVGVTHASLVGHSLGAAVAVTYALTRPARVERLALLSGCVPGFAWRPGWRARSWSAASTPRARARRRAPRGSARCARSPPTSSTVASITGVRSPRSIFPCCWSTAARIRPFPPRTARTRRRDSRAPARGGWTRAATSPTSSTRRS